VMGVQHLGALAGEELRKGARSGKRLRHIASRRKV
jgi:hypothetical protein